MSTTTHRLFVKTETFSDGSTLPYVEIATPDGETLKIDAKSETDALFMSMAIVDAIKKHSYSGVAKIADTGI